MILVLDESPPINNVWRLSSARVTQPPSNLT